MLREVVGRNVWWQGDNGSLPLFSCSAGPSPNSFGIESHWVSFSSWAFVISGQVRTHWHAHDSRSELTPQHRGDWVPGAVTEQVHPPTASSIPPQTGAAHYVQHTVEHLNNYSIRTPVSDPVSMYTSSLFQVLLSPALLSSRTRIQQSEPTSMNSAR